MPKAKEVKPKTKEIVFAWHFKKEDIKFTQGLRPNSVELDLVWGPEHFLKIDKRVSEFPSPKAYDYEKHRF